MNLVNIYANRFLGGRSESLISFIIRALLEVPKYLLSAPLQADLGCDDHFLALAILRQGATDEFFGAAKPIHRSRVEAKLSRESVLREWSRALFVHPFRPT